MIEGAANIVGVSLPKWALRLLDHIKVPVFVLTSELNVVAKNDAPGSNPPRDAFRQLFKEIPALDVFHGDRFADFLQTGDEIKGFATGGGAASLIPVKEAGVAILTVDPTVWGRRRGTLLSAIGVPDLDAEVVEDSQEFGTWSWNPSTGECVWDRRLHDIFEVPYGTPVTSQTFKDVVHPDDLGHVHEITEEAMHRPRNQGVLYFRILTPSGRVKLVQEIYTVKFDRMNRPTFLYGMLLDMTEQLAKSNALLTTQRMLREVQDCIHLGFAIWEPKRGLVHMDERLAQSVGLPFEVTTVDFEYTKQCVHPDDRPRLQGMLEGIQGGIKGLTEEFRVRLADGSCRTFLAFGITETTSNGEVVALNAFLLDVTEKREQQAISHRQGKLLETVFDNIPLAVMLIAPDGTVSMTNRFYQDLFGRSDGTEQPLESVVRQICGKSADADRFLQSCCHGETDWQTFPMLGTHGQKLWMKWNNVLLEDGSRIALGKDVTLEEDLLQELGYYFKASNEITVRIKRDGTIIRSSQAFEALLGYRAGELVAEDRYRLLHPDDLIKTQEAVERLYTEGKIENFTNRYIARSGKVKHLTWRAVVLPDTESCIATIRDVTDEIDLQREAKIRQDRLEHMRRLETLGTMTGHAAHELKNFLQVMEGSVELCLARVTDCQVTAESLKQIRQTVLEMRDVCDRLLLYAGKRRSSLETVDLSFQAVRSFNFIRGSLSPKATVKSNCTEKGIAVSVVGGAIDQVIFNLMRNASDALVDGAGEITLSCGTFHADEDFLASCYLGEELKVGQYAYLEVSDTGCGMSEGVRANIFSPFFTTKETGNGLGLPAVLGVVKAHNGAIQVRSEEGKGTTMRVVLPLADGLPQEVDSPAQDRRVELMVDEKVTQDTKSQSVVLFVEDEPNIRWIGLQSMKLRGIRAIGASDGEEALRLFRQHSHEIGVAVIDWIMPNMTGEELFQELRQYNPTLPIVFTSGYVDKVLDAKTLNAVNVVVMEKPYSFADLQEVLAGFMNRPGE